MFKEIIDIKTYPTYVQSSLSTRRQQSECFALKNKQKEGHSQRNDQAEIQS